jgi:hypothetical protein
MNKVDTMDLDERMDKLEAIVTQRGIVINELKTTLLGPSPGRNNGLRGELRVLEAKVDEALKWAQDIWNVRRKNECLGLEECKKVEQRILDKLEQEATMSAAKVNLRGVYAIGVLQFIGTLLVALIAAGVFKK